MLSFYMCVLYILCSDALCEVKHWLVNASVLFVNVTAEPLGCAGPAVQHQAVSGVLATAPFGW